MMIDVLIHFKVLTIFLTKIFKMTILAKLLKNRKQFVCMLLKPITFRLSPQKVIMIAITFTRSILCVNLKPTNFLNVFLVSLFYDNRLYINRQRTNKYDQMCARSPMVFVL